MNISNINANSLDMSSIINTRNKTITGDKFYVGEGILKCNNYFISLDSICMVEMGRRQNSILFFILLIVIGIILCIIPDGLVFGILGIVSGILGIAFVHITNQKIPYSMTIHLNNNTSCSYQSLDKEFMLEIMEVIQACINDRRGGYNILLNQGKIERNNNSINIGGNINHSNVDFISPGGSKENHGNNSINHQQQNDNTGLTAEEWINLEKYFIMRQQEFPMNDRNYKICGNLLTYSQRKDAGKIKSYLQTIGKEAIRTLFSASTNVAAMELVRPIVQKILSLKG